MAGARLSVNINKYALLRNSRGHDVPSLPETIDTVLAAGAHGITIHPRRDERHILMSDIRAVTDHLRTHHPGVELNIECENHPEVVERVLDARPDQCTLVPVRPGEVTSDHGYAFPADADGLRPTLDALRSAGIRSSIFMECTHDPAPFHAAAEVGTDRVELYTGPYAWAWGTEAQDSARAAAFAAAASAVAAGLTVNAGHDLDRHNLLGLRGLPGLEEVSIGHAQICRALWVGTPRAIQELLAALAC